MASTILPVITSKYIPPVLDLESGSDSEEVDLLSCIGQGSVTDLTSSLFVIDKKPSSNHGFLEVRKNKKLAQLDPGTDLKGYIPKKARHVKKFLNQDTEADRIYQEKCVLTREGFMTDMSIAPTSMSKNRAKKLKKLEKEKTSGNDWFNMPAQEITPELETDVQLLNMRDVLDPKRFYKKKSGIEKLKYFHVGTIVGPKSDYYNDLTRKEKKQTLVDELLSDVNFKSWKKKKYGELLKNNPQYLTMKKRMDKRKKQKEMEMKAIADRAGQSDINSSTPVETPRKQRKVKKVSKKQEESNVFKKKSKKK